MPTDELSSRRQRLDDLRQRGIDPYPSQVTRTHSLMEAIRQFDELQKKETIITVCGRVMAIRKHGGSTFLSLRDDGHALQAYCKKDVVGEDEYGSLANFDVGDFLQIRGTLFLTHKGERSILALSAPRLLTKSLRPLPEKWHGLSDTETRYRKRYLDLIMSESVRNAHSLRPRILMAMRNFFASRGFIEVETPVLQHIPGGATARPFITHLNALDIDLYLRVAPELYLKRLLIGGFNKIFEVARCFRNEGIDHAHNPEFTMIELYQVYASYRELMKLIEDLMIELAGNIIGANELIYGGQKIDLTPPYVTKDWMSILEEAIGEEVKHLDDDKLKSLLKRKGLELEASDGRGVMLDKAYKKFVRSHIIQPTFLVDHPICLSPLAKRHEKKTECAERFQLVVGGGIELVNGFSELNDPVDQRARFEEQENLRQAGDDEAQRMDEDFLEAQEYGMPPAAGLGIGVDRLVALLTGNHSLKEVILFPTLRPKD